MDSTEQTRLFSEFPPVGTETWEARILADLKGADYQKRLIWKTYDGIAVKPYYRSADLEGIGYLGVPPDEVPYVRGTRVDAQSWSIRQDFKELDIKSLNEQMKSAISKGVDAVGIRVAQINTHKQMEELLEGVDLKDISINFISSPSYPLTLELFIYQVMHRDIPHHMPKGSLNFDPIGYLLRRGEFYANWQQNLEEAEYLIQTVGKKLPSFKAVSINAHYFQDAGSTLVQELAFGLASACEYLAGLTDKGLTIDQVAPYMQFSFATGPHYFLEIAKLRAARLLWNRMVEQFHPKDPESSKIQIHSATAKWNKSLFDPYVNMLRTTTEGMSAILGNADSVTIDPFNALYQDPDDFSARIARNQQLVLREESYLDKVVDPAAGSYYIEKLTSDMATHAWDLFRSVEKAGGLLECIRSGFIQEEVATSRKEKEEDVAQRRLVLLGTNQFPNLTEKVVITDIEEPSNVPETTVIQKLNPYRAAAGFESLRIATEKFVANGNQRPKVFLFTMGNLAMLRARAGFATNFFGCAGYEIIDNPGFATIQEGVSAFAENPSALLVICSSDEEYPGIVPGITEAVKHLPSIPLVVLAGYPKEQIESFRQAGVMEFIHLRSDLYATLKRFQNLLGIMLQ
jgi:methylmalonyl-CoA mutase